MENNSLLMSLWTYLKKPRYDLERSKESFKKKLSDILKYWSLGVVIAFVVGTLSTIFLHNTGIDDSQNILQDFFMDNSIFKIVLLVFFVGPIIEELTFRLGLRYSPYRFGFSLAFVFFLLFQLLLTVNSRLGLIFDKLFNSLGVFYFLIILSILIIASGFLFSWIVSRKNISKKISKYYQDKFPIIFYGLSSFFAVAHIFNFSNFNDLWLALPFVVAPQLFLGFILSYIRMRYSLAWSMFYHVFHNTMTALPILFLSHISSKSYDIILEGGEKIQDIPFSDKIFLILGVGLGGVIFFLVLIFFFLFLNNHKKYLKFKMQQDYLTR